MQEPSRASEILPSASSNAAKKPGAWHWEVAVACVLLVLLTWAAFAPVLWNGFVNYDDDLYVTENLIVARGLSVDGLRWAFTRIHSCNWHPLTWISHMLDCQVFGLRPWGHHLSSVMLHTLAAILLFLMLRELTARRWRSAFVAAVFAVHPLRVESVAWVAERKDVLSAVFFILTLWAYVRYAHKAEGRRKREETPGNFRLLPSAFSLSFWLVVVFFLMGLMSKPMLVTVPFVLLLLDCWPLGRMSANGAGTGAGRQRLGNPQVRRVLRLVVEKLPLFALSAVSCVITVMAQRDAMTAIEKLAPVPRIGNAFVAYVVYLGQTVWPVHLTALYPVLTEGPPMLQVFAALILLVALTAVAFACRRRQPALLVGWFWYLGMLVPVIGIMQVGEQAHADRYTYLPQIGLLLAITWVASDWAGQQRGRQAALAALAGLVLCVLTAATFHQAAYWRDSIILWTRALDVTRNNCIAHNDLGSAIYQQGKVAEAIAHYHEALRINPAYADAYNNLGVVLDEQGNILDAIPQYREALRINPGYADAHANLGNALLRQGELEDAIIHCREALRLDPADANARNSLGNALLQQGQGAEAIREYREALRLDPSHAPARHNLAIGLFLLGQTQEALKQMEESLQIQPDHASFQSQFAWMLATAPEVALRNGPRAVEIATKANQATGGSDSTVLKTLAAAYAQAGDFPVAIQTAQRALQIAEERSETAQADSLRRDLEIYKAGRALETGE